MTEQLTKREAEKRFGPLPYDLGAGVAKYRRLGNVRPLTRAERLEHAAAIEKSIRAKQRTLHTRATPPMTPGWYVPPSVSRLLKYDNPLPMVGDPPYQRKGDIWANREKALLGISDA